MIKKNKMKKTKKGDIVTRFWYTLKKFTHVQLHKYKHTNQLHIHGLFYF
jgi:hypothetical protein